MALSTPALNALTRDQLRAGADLLAEAIPPGTPEHTDLVRRIDVRDDLARITAPTLVISTTGDPLVSPALHRQLADQIPGARLAEIATGHLPFAERPKEWLELITTFLGEHTPNA
ncbi:alpha/beta fold hydrolase [Streptomyces sp. NBC_00358]|uniref:alpha/beta fold hydrolase n=1 Tax=Streptomyces sp. NBC_00358 TaxID=2975725 RepID=UPI002E274315